VTLSFSLQDVASLSILMVAYLFLVIFSWEALFLKKYALRLSLMAAGGICSFSAFRVFQRFDAYILVIVFIAILFMLSRLLTRHPAPPR
jgi:hypothetical protein